LSRRLAIEIYSASKMLPRLILSAGRVITQILCCDFRDLQPSQLPFILTPSPKITEIPKEYISQITKHSRFVSFSSTFPNLFFPASLLLFPIPHPRD